MSLRSFLLPLMLAVLPLACSSRAAAATPTVTPLPASSFTAEPSSAPQPTRTSPPPADTPDALGTLVPSGPAARQWEGIPIMPGALAGEGDDLGYAFTTHAAPERVAEYYRTELEKLGWQYLPNAEGVTGAALLIFTGIRGTLTVSTFPHGDETLVLLVK